MILCRQTGLGVAFPARSVTLMTVGEVSAVGQAGGRERSWKATSNWRYSPQREGYATFNTRPRDPWKSQCLDHAIVVATSRSGGSTGGFRTRGSERSCMIG